MQNFSINSSKKISNNISYMLNILGFFFEKTFSLSLKKIVTKENWLSFSMFQFFHGKLSNRDLLLSKKREFSKKRPF